MSEMNGNQERSKARIIIGSCVLIGALFSIVITPIALVILMLFMCPIS